MRSEGDWLIIGKNMETTNQKREVEILDEIAKFIRQIKYGEVVIKIHNERVVEIEKKEKKRF
jgi:hypothetical protein